MYYDLLVRMKNAVRAEKESFNMPYSKFDHAVANFLVKEKFVASVEKRSAGKKSVLDVRLFDKSKKNTPSDFKLISKPSRRIYAGYRDLKQVKQGHGVAALSTPEGVMSNREARKKKLGGEYLFEIW